MSNEHNEQDNRDGDKHNEQDNRDGDKHDDHDGDDCSPDVIYVPFFSITPAHTASK